MADYPSSDYVTDIPKYWNDSLVNNDTLDYGNNITNSSRDVIRNGYDFYQTEQLAFLWVLFIMIVLGNSSVLAALMLSKSKKSRMNFFIMQLAIADLSVGLISVLTDIVWKFTLAWYAGNIACKFVKFLQVLVTYSSTYVLVALSIDRYDAITHPMNFSGSWVRARWLIAIAWAMSGLFSIPMLIVSSETQDQYAVLQCTIEIPKDWWRLYMSLVAVSVFFIPAFIITACYTIIVMTIWSKGKILTPMKQCTKNDHVKGQTKDGDADTKRASSRGLIPKAKIKTVKMTFAIVFVFILCWSPYFIYDLLQVYGVIPNEIGNMGVTTFIQSLAPLNSAANPIIYCLFSTHICRNLRKIPFFNWIGEHVCVCCPALQKPLRDSTSTRRSDYTTMSESLSRSSRRSNGNSTRYGANLALKSSVASRKYIVANESIENNFANSGCKNSKV